VRLHRLKFLKHADSTPSTHFLKGGADTPLAEYQEQGFTLSVRQLCYQAVARGIVAENSERSYRKIDMP
jgi:hypothetical protein